LKKILKKNKFLKYLYRKIKRRPLYEKQETFKEVYIDDYIIDDNSFNVLQKIDYELLIRNNQKNFKKWKNFLHKQNLKKLNLDVSDKINPWCYPVLARNQSEQIKWLNWGWKNNIDVFTWPTLPEEMSKKYTSAYKLWSKLICFSTKTPPPNTNGT